MSAIVERVAAEHEWRAAIYDDDGETVSSEICQCAWSGEDHGTHLIEVTEAAVRAQIAADIETAHPADDHATQAGIAWVGGWQAAIGRAARIAAGGAS